jgi:heat shock protein HslJ
MKSVIGTRIPAAATLAVVGISLTLGWPHTVTAGEHEDDAAGGSPAPTYAELSAATYSGFEDLEPVTLVDGKWRGEPYVEGGVAAPSVWLDRRLYLTGDLDGDGVDEAVAHLAQSGGGTGSYGYLVVMGRADGGLAQKGISLVGDRVQIRAARVAGKTIELDVLQAGPDDGMCCPSQLATRVFTMGNDGLVETGSSLNGALSLEALEGVTWVLREDDAKADLPPVTLVFDSGKVSGSAGCNRFNGTVASGTTASNMQVGPLMTTRMACPGPLMQREQAFLETLGQTEVFSFMSGDLVLSGPGGRLDFSPSDD